jgi:hypothetical protein
MRGEGPSDDRFSGVPQLRNDHGDRGDGNDLKIRQRG